MPDIRSPQWDEALGVCEKHNIPQIPCPQCIAEQDPDVEVQFDEMDLLVAEGEEAVTGEAFPLSDLLPEGCEWLLKRAV